MAHSRSHLFGRGLSWIVFYASTLTFIGSFFTGYYEIDDSDFRQDILVSSAYGTLSPNSFVLTFPLVSKEVRDWPFNYKIPADPPYNFTYNPSGNTSFVFAGNAATFISASALAYGVGVKSPKVEAPKDAEGAEAPPPVSPNLISLWVFPGFVPGYLLGITARCWATDRNLDEDAKNPEIQNEALNELYTEIARALIAYDDLDPSLPNGSSAVLTNFIRTRDPTPADRQVVHMLFSQLEPNTKFQGTLTSTFDIVAIDSCELISLVGAIIWLGTGLFCLWPWLGKSDTRSRK